MLLCSSGQGNEELERQRERELHTAKEHAMTIANEEAKFTQWRSRKGKWKIGVQ